MIYELALVAKAELPENELEALSEMVKDVLKEGNGELFIEDDWGKLNLGQPTSKGVRRGFFKYFIFKLDPQTNKELTRRILINEGILKSLLLSLEKLKSKIKLSKLIKHLILRNIREALLLLQVKRVKVGQTLKKIRKDSREENRVGLLLKKLKLIGKTQQLTRGLLMNLVRSLLPELLG